MRISASVLAAAAAFSLGATIPAGAQQVGPSVVVDAVTGQVLQADRAGLPWLPASLTKMMTAYVTLRQVREGHIAMNTGLRVSPRAARSTPSKMGFRPGTIVTVDNALKIIMVKSANDVSVTIAEGIGGSVEGFVAMMNAEARRLGMTATRFVNPHGLPGAGQSTSARDMAVLARALMREFPEHSLLWRMPAIRYGSRVMRNHNHLIGRYQGADGFKTGFTCASGFNVVATATRGGRQLIVVVLGATSARGRAETAAGLFERHFASFGGGGPSIDAVMNDSFRAPPDIRDQACRRRGRGPAYIESGEEFDAEPVISGVDPANLSYAQMMAAPTRARRTATLGAFAAIPGAVPSLLGPYRPSMDPVPVFTGGAAPAAPAPALASSRSVPAALPVPAVAAAPAPTVTVTTTATPPVLPAAGAIARRGASAPAEPARPAHGAITRAARAEPAAAGSEPAGAPLSLQGAVPLPRPAAAPGGARASRSGRTAESARAERSRPAQPARGRPRS